MDNASDRKLRIADAANTYNYALAAIYDKGYKVFLFPDPYHDGKQDFWAIKDGRDFIGSDPLAVLGLIGLWERFGDDWRMSVNIPKYHKQLFDKTFPDDDYASLSEYEFEALVQDFRIFFDAIGEQMPRSLTRKNVAEFMNNFSRIIEDRANEA